MLQNSLTIWQVEGHFELACERYSRRVFTSKACSDVLKRSASTQHWQQVHQNSFSTNRLKISTSSVRSGKLKKLPMLTEVIVNCPNIAESSRIGFALHFCHRSGIPLSCKVSSAFLSSTAKIVSINSQGFCFDERQRLLHVGGIEKSLNRIRF